jgi:tetratricopeptide (TPR) repeat protein
MRSAEVAKAGGEADETYHASDYAVYAYLQLTRDAAAHDLIANTLKVMGTSPGRPTAPYAAAAMQARYAVERGDWKAAMQLQPVATPYAFTDSITYFARALGAIRSGDVAAAEREAQALADLHKKLVDAKNTYWATEVEVQRLAVAGWTEHAKGNAAEGLKLMRAAADLEDRNEKHIVTPARIVPARELLGEMLLEQKQPAQALKEFEASQLREPNRFRNFAGAAQAAEMAGDRAKAAAYYGKLLELARNGDGKRPELSKAKAMLAQR